ncbi:hypothetical protein WJX73_005159 [Symbiochloris irregularis]|uniref:Uncharacterized protein n=1 Tax=Symbiochloris irregularis TaxID=706552 RepID=A0AAW1PHJ9_9CHLO
MQANPATTPTISYLSLQRSRRTLQDFVQSYFAYVGLQQQDLFKFLDILVFVEGSIYQMDEENEALAKAGREPAAGLLQGEQILQAVLEQQGLLDQQVQDQLLQGKEYWRLERQLCKAMSVSEATDAHCCSFKQEDVLEASSRKSFDYRVLHLLMLKLTGQPVNDTLFAFLNLDERLVDMGDDLVDYEDDVLANSFNVLRGFVHLYGRHAHMHLVSVISGLEQQHARLLQQLPAHIQHHHRQRHQQASVTPGSGDWVFPTAILDEAKFRQQHQEAN